MATVVRWNPMREFNAMQEMMDRIFEENRMVMRNGTNTRALALDVHETDSTYTVMTVLPGLNPDDITVNLHENVLTIGAEIAKPEIDENTRVLLRERHYGNFSRSVTLPQDVDADNVEAAYENGVLTLSLPKVPQAQPRQIPVKANNILASEN